MIKRLTIEIDADTHKAFKIWCYNNDYISMTEAIKEMIEEKLTEKEESV